MEEPKHLSDTEAFRESSLNSLAELQRFLSEELEDLESTPGNFQRAFRPLTDGLGLESPKRAEEAVRPIPLPDTSDLFFDTDPVVVPPALQSSKLQAVPVAAPRQSLERTLESIASTAEAASFLAQTAPIAPITPAKTKAGDLAVPPPLPHPSLFMRIQAALIDDVFVLTLWVGALVITANLMSGFTTGFSLALVKEFSQPLFLRFAALEFATLWLSYFALCIGILDMTFGMWVWGIRIAYGEDGSEDDGQSRFAKKGSRIIFSFFFFAPLLPSLLLAFRIRGKNLLDSMSGTALYCVGD